jgi:hypothetical protein
LTGYLEWLLELSPELELELDELVAGAGVVIVEDVLDELDDPPSDEEDEGEVDEGDPPPSDDEELVEAVDEPRLSVL